MEANDYALLFAPMDQETKGNGIWDTYLGPKAKVQVNVSDRTIKEIGDQIGEKKYGNALFVKAQQVRARGGGETRRAVCYAHRSVSASGGGEGRGVGMIPALG